MILSIPIQTSELKPIIKQGDTIQKTVIKFSEGVDLLTSSVKIQLYNENTLALEITNGNGVTIIDALTFEIDKIRNNTLPLGTLKGDVQVTDSNGDNTTWFNIELTITKQRTV